jgi:hypothetical protein
VVTNISLVRKTTTTKIKKKLFCAKPEKGQNLLTVQSVKAFTLKAKITNSF